MFINDKLVAEAKAALTSELYDITKDINDHVNRHGEKPCDYLLVRQNRSSYLKGKIETFNMLSEFTNHDSDREWISLRTNVKLVDYGHYIIRILVDHKNDEDVYTEHVCLWNASRKVFIEKETYEIFDRYYVDEVLNENN